jgi:hypothetical protein
MTEHAICVLAVERRQNCTARGFLRAMPIKMSVSTNILSTVATGFQSSPQLPGKNLLVSDVLSVRPHSAERSIDKTDFLPCASLVLSVCWLGSGECVHQLTDDTKTGFGDPLERFHDIVKGGVSRFCSCCFHCFENIMSTRFCRGSSSRVVHIAHATELSPPLC